MAKITCNAPPVYDDWGGWEEAEAIEVARMRVAERLKDDLQDWIGMSRAEYARREVIRRRMRERERRMRLSAFARAVAIVDAPETAPIALHRTTSGQLAYQVMRFDTVISVPWVSVLAEAA